MDSELKNSIFQSIPKNLDGMDVIVEYADRCRVSQKLKNYPVVVTLKYFGNKTDTSRTPLNRLLGVEKVDDEITYTKGKYQQVTLSLNVYAVDTEGQLAGDIIDDYLQLLQVWVMRDLPDIVEVAGENEISDLSFLETSAERRNYDIRIRHELSYIEVVSAVSSVETTIIYSEPVVLYLTTGFGYGSTPYGSGNYGSVCEKHILSKGVLTLSP